jgi:hypothetical protein
VSDLPPPPVLIPCPGEDVLGLGIGVDLCPQLMGMADL